MNDALKYFNRENYRRALELFLENLENATTDDERAYNANLAGLCLYFLHYPDEALNYFNIALENSQGEENEKVQNNINEVNRFVERIKEDIENIKSKLEGEDDKRKRGILLSNLGLLHYFIGMRDEAEKNYDEAEKIFKILRDNIALGAVYSNRAMLYDDMRQLDYLYRALDIFEKEGHLKGQVDTLHSLALYYLDDDYIEEAYYFLNKELKILENVDDKELKRRAYELAGDIAMEMGNVEEAMKYTERASQL